MQHLRRTDSPAKPDRAVIMRRASIQISSRRARRRAGVVASSVAGNDGTGTPLLL